MRSLALALVLFLAALATPARADDSAGSRVLRLAATYQGLTGSPSSRTFEDTARSAPGIAGNYEFAITPRFSLGLALAYRHYGGDRSMSQLGYGALLRHAFPSLASGSFAPYLSYGLLMQVTRIEGIDGSGMSHDTRLTIGADLDALRLPLFAELSYHVSRLGFLGVDSVSLDYWETSIGWRVEL